MGWPEYLVGSGMIDKVEGMTTGQEPVTDKAMQRKKMAYRFEEGSAEMSELLGGKGANLSEMVNLGLPVPPGFIITTEACLEYYDKGHQLLEDLLGEIQAQMLWLEERMERGFGSTEAPLLVSVRSGARVSMPGMMDTILNLGINDEIAEGLGKIMNDPRTALDIYRRFFQTFGSVVMGVESSAFEEILAKHKKSAGVQLDHELDPDRLRGVIADYKSAVRGAAGQDVPEDQWRQLTAAIEAVFQSWNSQRAITYRDHYNLPHHWGTAVNIMPMVFGNMGEDSGTGVLFTRNPLDGRKHLYGEFLSNAQGEDVVAGVRNPEPVSSLATRSPRIYEELSDMAGTLERHYKDMQDIEFTIEAGRLYLLQTRKAQRTVQAAVKIAVDMANEELITRQEALKRPNPEDLSQLFVPRFDPKAKDWGASFGGLLAKGFGASPGAASGKAYFDATRAAEAAEAGIPVILVRPETKPEDIHGIIASKGVLTSRGGVTSHAALVARGLGVPCVVGCEEVQVNLDRQLLVANGQTIREGEDLSVDGTSGEVFAGAIATVKPLLDELGEAQVLLSWADDVRRLGIWANADTPADAQRAVSMGAEGIGLCRTEHMFLGPQRVPVVQRLLLNAAEAERWESENPEAVFHRLPSSSLPVEVNDFYEALGRLKQFQVDDFTQILRAMGARPVIIRLLDAPLHEFLPRHEDLVREALKLEAIGTAEQLESHGKFLHLVESLRESNPMLGHRGCRLGITFPAVYEMQVEAIMIASARLLKEGSNVHPEIMIPLTSHVNEMWRLKERLTKAADKAQREAGTNVKYLLGTMIEVPRAALTAGEIAAVAEFFSFGTNDLTQTTYGFSRDDAEGKFLNRYLSDEILPANPFTTLDYNGVGALIRMAVEQGRRTRPDLEVGLCGEHGGDPASIAFCHKEGLDYVSCSPFRVPVARLAAAQAALG